MRKVRIPDTVQLYWQCEHCKQKYEFPQTTPHRFCSMKCKNAAAYQKKKSNA